MTVSAYLHYRSPDATATFPVATFDECASQIQLERLANLSSLSSESLVFISLSRYTGSLDSVGLSCPYGASVDLLLLTQISLAISKLLIS